MADTIIGMLNDNMQESAELPIFAEGKYENIKIALTRGIFSRPTYFYATDLNVVGYIDSDLVIHLPENVESTSVQRVPILPSADNAKDNVIYIFNNIAYIFNDGKYEPLAEDYGDDIQNIQLDIINIKTQLENLKQTSSTSVTEAPTISQFPTIGDANHVYISLSENASYRWDPYNLRYVCVGRDYMNIKQINGGSAESR